MQIGMIGLGKMGGNMAERLARGGHTVMAFDRDAAAVRGAADRGSKGAESLEALATALAAPRVVWLMVPSGNPTEETLTLVSKHLTAGDIVVDGGNSKYTDSMRRAAQLAERGITFLDVGVSGGIWGLREGYCLMIGGEKAAVTRLTPIFETLAPAPDRGWTHVGKSGAGHFVKMIHNGIEYGMMQAFAEGFAIMHKKADLALDLPQIAEVWRHGSVVRSWLLDLTARALSADPTMAKVAPFVSDSGEGRWTVAEAIDLDVAAPVITLSLLTRLRSRDEESFSDRVLAALRAQFGGHAVKSAT
ncbi:MAG TPA: decarboxylating 6-phosphogluconate dehydrogenase [Gemmatimonadaceae bacterium]|jgi:6-phosphogluconate dehydrogenase|nr:decarboxylating 6-phosphogluconate dehydrogenase [Gemmatimonadaceae bacterium]